MKDAVTVEKQIVEDIRQHLAKYPPLAPLMKSSEFFDEMRAVS